MTRFVTIQFFLLPTLGILALLGSGVKNELPRLPKLNNDPVVVRPMWDDNRIVTDEQLAIALKKLRFANQPKPKINHVDHALRMWGLPARLDDQFLDGNQMVSMLTEDGTYKACWGEKARSLIVSTATGPRYRTQEGAASSSHVDHTLATFAEVGLPLDYRIDSRHGLMELRTLVERALTNFSLNQREYEWTALVWGLYAADANAWRSREGQQVTFDRLASRIMRQQFGQGVCYGGHRLFSLVMLRRIDIEQQRLFSDEMRSVVDAHLLEATRLLVANQSPEGYWDRTWPGEPIGEIRELWELGSRFLATSHAMEWWAMAPEHLLPPRETLIRAGQWMVVELEKMDAVTTKKNYTFLTHAGRSLALWRGGFPHELYSESNSKSQSSTYRSLSADLNGAAP